MSVALVFVFVAGVVGTEAQVPKLDRLTPPVAPGAAVEPTGRALPAAQVICVDRAARRCWSGERPEDCRTQGGSVFATAPAPGGDPGALLVSCWEQVR